MLVSLHVFISHSQCLFNFWGVFPLSGISPFLGFFPLLVYRTSKTTILWVHSIRNGEMRKRVLWRDMVYSLVGVLVEADPVSVDWLTINCGEVSGLVAADGRANPLWVVRIHNHFGGNVFVARHKRPRGQLARDRWASFLYTWRCVPWVEADNFYSIIIFSINTYT